MSWHSFVQICNNLNTTCIFRLNKWGVGAKLVTKINEKGVIKLGGILLLEAVAMGGMIETTATKVIGDRAKAIFLIIIKRI